MKHKIVTLFVVATIISGLATPAFAAQPITSGQPQDGTPYASLYWEVKLLVDQLEDPYMRQKLYTELSYYNLYMTRSLESPNVNVAIAWAANGLRVLFNVAYQARTYGILPTPDTLIIGLMPKMWWCKVDTGKTTYGEGFIISCPDSDWRYYERVFECDWYFTCWKAQPFAGGGHKSVHGGGHLAMPIEQFDLWTMLYNSSLSIQDSHWFEQAQLSIAASQMYWQMANNPRVTPEYAPRYMETSINEAFYVIYLIKTYGKPTTGVLLTVPLALLLTPILQSWEQGGVTYYYYWDFTPRGWEYRLVGACDRDHCWNGWTDV
jgi:hypothetical protein